MKTKIIALLFALACCQGIRAEYAVINRIVYDLNLRDLTATVLNFQTSTYDLVSVSIPEQIVYKGDTYKVTSLSYNAFDYDALIDYSETVKIFGETAPLWYSTDEALKREKLERKFQYEYAEARANIEFLYLPSTLKTISSHAFDGMSRLKRLIIPASVYDFSKYCFEGNVRLENITFEGIPHICHSYYEGSWLGAEQHELCLDDNDPIAVLDSLELKEKWQYYCPKLQAIEFLPLKEFLLYKNKLDKSYVSYSKRLRDSISVYKVNLTQHPYYIEDYYFKDIGYLPKPTLTTNRTKEDYAAKSISLKNDYNRLLTLCREEYKRLWANMEQNCKQNTPNIYADRYCAYNPEFSAQIDSLLKDYQCAYTKQELTIAILENYQLEEKCQDKLWKKYFYLYKDRETFLSEYNIASDIKHEIYRRDGIYYVLKEEIKKNNIQLKGKYDSDDNTVPVRKFRTFYDKMKENEIPISFEIIEQDPEAQKEFEKNGQYFEGPDEFFAAYITSNYKNILKEKKKAKK